MSSMTVQERIAYIIDEREGGSAISFCRRTGIGKCSVSKIMNGNSGLGKKGIGPYFERIVAAYKSVNPMWLATGEGAPFHYSPRRDEIEAKLDNLEKKVGELLVLMKKVAKNA